MKLINYDSKSFSEYKSNLQLIGSLSLLFSESDDPYLDYRVPEKLYCDSFGAEDLSRRCVTADAKLGTIGVGIKTFTEGNKKSIQKIAEFNKARKSYSGLHGIDKVRKIAELRNERIISTISTYGLKSMIYHCIVRNKEGFHFYEEPMEEIDITNLKILTDTETSIIFTDGRHEYNFNISKSVLQKKFTIEEYFDNISVEVAKNPFDVLKKGIGSLVTITENDIAIIPLYSYKKGIKFVFEKSGLNQWNASEENRPRKPNEIYIPFNGEIKDKYKDFFPDKNTPFEVTLPSGEIMSMKMCQGNDDIGKAIMSNPNSALGEWILREVLRLEENELLTYDKLAEIGIESVSFEKDDVNNYKVDFIKIEEANEDENSQE